MSLIEKTVEYELVRKCRELATSVIGQIRHGRHMSLLSVPEGFPLVIAAPYPLVWDFKKRAWGTSPETARESQSGCYFDLASESILSHQLRDQALAWAKEVFPQEGKHFCWAHYQRGLEVLPDGVAPNPAEQGYVLLMQGMLFS